MDAGEDAATDQATDARRAAMAAFAQADLDRLRTGWEALGLADTPQPLRGPETGLVMLRGRIGGSGAPFNLGEASVTRATIRLGDEIGHAMVLGRAAEKAALAACLDAAWQRPALRARVEALVLDPARAAATEADRILAEETAATRVDFFTVARGDD